MGLFIGCCTYFPFAHYQSWGEVYRIDLQVRRASEKNGGTLSARATIEVIKPHSLLRFLTLGAQEMSFLIKKKIIYCIGEK